MKSKKYENFSMLPFLLIFAIIFFIFLLIFSFRVSFIKIYHSIPGVVVGPNQVMVLLSSKDLSWLYHNRFVFISGKKRKFSIERVEKNLIKRDKKVYHQVFLEVSIPKKYLENDSITLVIYQKDCSFSSIFFDIWKGG